MEPPGPTRSSSFRRHYIDADGGKEGYRTAITLAIILGPIIFALLK